MYYDTTKGWHQQGDVKIHPLNMKSTHWRIDQIKGAEKKEVDGPLVLAYGEASGHSHKLVPTKMKIIKYMETWNSDEIVFELLEDTVLQHEEHGEILIPKGIYIMEKVKEQDHFANAARVVED